ncbi:Scr1 family TA system antitoxin-like transcriptional regulator [Streptomyces virginiae]|uniref:Scr1 family TA system antitoxin-like transcriptional regulator n=1 Tax=Streptomyces virginiae TaxID=1961 RepID=UPI0037249D25
MGLRGDTGLQADVVRRASTDRTATTMVTRARPKRGLRRQDRLLPPGNPLRLWAVLDESVQWRVVGSPEVMREQPYRMTHLSAQPHISVQVLLHIDMYAHAQAQVLSPDMTGNFIEEALKVYAGKEFRPDARALSLPRVYRVLGADHSQAPLSPWTAGPGAQSPNGGPGGSLCA